MERTDQDFQDGLALDLFSPKNRTLKVQQNTSPLPAQFVSGANGEPFIALSNYSYILRMNETANDLIAKIEIPYDPVMLSSLGIQEANTYVATLSEDKKSWIINDKQRNVHRSENNTRIIKMTSMDGEYLLVGRRTEDTANIFIQYGQGETRTLNLTGGPGIQQAEFVDGLRFSVQTESSMRINVDLKQGVDPTALPANTVSLNSYAWEVNSSSPHSNIVGEMRFPCEYLLLAINQRTLTSQVNRMMLAALLPAESSPMLTVAMKPLNATKGMFMPTNSQSQKVYGMSEDRIVVPGMALLDGQYIILVTMGPGIGN